VGHNQRKNALMVHFYTAYLTAGDYKTNGKIVQLKTIDFYFLELRSKFG